ncbi:MAG: tRNA preQ1(34) S-adenosylmethionine ribosyltransferase-isomerase QueA [Pirellulaceae bacterium]
MNSEVAGQTPAEQYDFQLPKELIAQQPTRNREDARLMIVDRARQSIAHAHFRDLSDYLRPGDCLVLNETKVILAKLVGYRTSTGGRWQGLYLDHDRQSDVIKVMCKTRGRIQPGETVTLQDREGLDRMRLTMVTRLDNGCWAVRVESMDSLEQFLEQVGRVPLPHYIRDGNMTDADVEDYQTVYARSPGSIAAPTAGLHFTDRLLGKLVQSGINVCRITLHVGTGTFRPIATETIEEHQMHAEFGSITQPAIDVMQSSRDSGGRIIAVGTTSVRLLETLGQSLPLQPWQGPTDLYIQPGFQFRVVDAVITNFHLPRTTLLVLARAFGGNELMVEAYRQAIEQKYRFFSYGDAMLIL